MAKSKEELDEETIIRELVHKKYGDPDFSDERVKRRISQFLVRRCFSTSAIMNFFG